MPSLEEAGADERWREVPIGGEIRPELQATIFTDTYAPGTYQQEFDDCVAATHASMLLFYEAFSGGLGGSDARRRAEEAALGLGYLLHVEQASLEGRTLTVRVENRGAAPFYHPLALRLWDGNGVMVEQLLPAVQPAESPVDVELTVADLAAPTSDRPWTLGLYSEHVLPSQTIRFATAPGDGPIRVQ